MARIVVAVIVVLALVGLSARVASAKSAPQIARSGGLGNTRGDFAHAYGKPVGDTFDDIAKALHTDTATYQDKKTQTQYVVGFLVAPDNTLRSTDRAFDIAVLVPDPQAVTLDQATAIAKRLLPKDAKASGDLVPVDGAAGLLERTYASAKLGKAIPDAAWYADGAPGHFAVSLQANANGSYNAVTIGTDVQ